VKVHCHSCRRLLPAEEMHHAEVLTARQTHWSPAEYDGVDICEDCFTGDGPDEDYERAERSDEWERRGGGGL
jgi:hypothetical protein